MPAVERECIQCVRQVTLCSTGVSPIGKLSSPSLICGLSAPAFIPALYDRLRSICVMSLANYGTGTVESMKVKAAEGKKE